MPLLKKPTPAVPREVYHIRIDQPLAIKLKKYSEFLGSKNVDYVVSEALSYVFQKDVEFKQWLEEQPPAGLEGDVLEPSARKGKPNGTGAALEPPKSQQATARATI